ncbi:hypothetical protein FA95DRAFT_1610098 [Auriscalpium vulgare]|uniref:Uncharacterized protein n=1 Tax=Auriscalpium vulgare TaxID=40419 RepID=A0ACB8RFB9_9AGAM|nr:hypothetical protein FA95DRAFT_1610098 [Auriscalpium vulgare]
MSTQGCPFGVDPLGICLPPPLSPISSTPILYTSCSPSTLEELPPITNPDAPVGAAPPPTSFVTDTSTVTSLPQGTTTLSVQPQDTPSSVFPTPSTTPPLPISSAPPSQLPSPSSVSALSSPLSSSSPSSSSSASNSHGLRTPVLIGIAVGGGASLILLLPVLYILLWRRRRRRAPPPPPTPDPTIPSDVPRIQNDESFLPDIGGNAGGRFSLWRTPTREREAGGPGRKRSGSDVRAVGREVAIPLTRVVTGGREREAGGPGRKRSGSDVHAVGREVAIPLTRVVTGGREREAG